MDSGASSHITNERDDFYEYTPYEKFRTFTTANNSKESNVYGMGEGTVKAYSSVEGKLVEITLHNVVYVPNASGRLFSTGTIEGNKYFLMQGDGQMSIWDKLPIGGLTHGSVIRMVGKRLLTARYAPRQNQYYLRVKRLDRGETKVLNVKELQKSFELWHRRFGHLNDEAVKRLPKSTIGVPGIGPKDFTVCEGCALGKKHRSPFPPSEKRATKRGELTHTDVDGPMRNASVNGGYLYFVTFLDDFSGLAYVCYLKHKSEVFKAFLTYKAWFENQTGEKIKRVRSDRGGEYMSAEFQAYCKEHGIEHHKTAPHSPQQNGRAERFNQTVVEKAMSMLHQAGLSYGFWQFAVEAAVHIYNRQPIRRHQWKCPITVWSDTVPDVSYFRVFGCRAFVHVPEAQHRKLEKKALELMFVGYEPGSKAWRFWNHSTRSVVMSRDVTFDEDSFPARLRGLPGPPDEPLSLPDPETDSDDEGPPDAPLFPDDNNLIPPPPPVPAPAPPPPPVQPPAPPANPPNYPQPDPVGDIPPDPPAPRRHQRGRHPPVEEQPPSLARDRPRRENAGVPPKPPGQNLHGPGTPLEIDAGMGPKGGYKRKTTVETIQDEWEDNVDGIRAMLNAASARRSISLPFQT